MLSSNSAARGHCYPSSIQAWGHASCHPGGTCPGCVPCTVVGRVALTQGSSHGHSLLLTLLVLRTTLSFQLSETTGNSFPFLVSWSPKHADNPRACIHSVLPFSSTICLCSQSCGGKKAVLWPETPDWSHTQPTLCHYVLWDLFFSVLFLTPRLLP